MELPPIKDCWFLTGATATGKTAVGVELALRLNAEIISMDSMSLYRHMDIGTAKPEPAELARVPHHLIDIIEPNEEYSVAQYVEAAHHCAEEIKSRGKTVLFVGGTPLYLKALLRGIFQGPAADWPFRHKLQQEAQEHGPEYLHNRLQEVDPPSAARLHVNDSRRIIRALEIFHLTARPISEFQKQFEVGQPAEECRVYVLDWPREQLHARIKQRVAEMFAHGLVDEVRGLLNGPKPLGKTAGQAVGYREVIEHLSGRHSLEQTQELVELHTRQLAKRQCTWFRSLSECRFMAQNGEKNAADIACQIAD